MSVRLGTCAHSRLFGFVSAPERAIAAPPVEPLTLMKLELPFVRSTGIVIGPETEPLTVSVLGVVPTGFKRPVSSPTRKTPL
jgi:hypothetical protein